MRKSFASFVLYLTLGTAPVWAQTTFPQNGVHDQRPGVVAFTNGVIHTDHRTVLENATLIIREGRVEAVGRGVRIPQGARVIDLGGKHIYPGFVDLYSTYGVPEVSRPGSNGRRPPQIETAAKGAVNWNQAIHPETNAISMFTANAKQAEELRAQGFSTVLTFQPDGIARGTAALVNLADKRDNEIIIRDKAAATFSFSKGTSTQDYPQSLMGSIALLRQTYLDADWYAQSRRPMTDVSLQAFQANRALPQIFEAGDKFDILRADRVGDEFGIQYIIKGGGDEYQRLADIKATRAPLIVPVNFPDAYDVEDPFDAMMTSLEDMKHWELAPANAALLAREAIPFALTTAGLKEKNTFLANVRKAIIHGLSEEEALRALTSRPAELIGAQQEIGSLRPGAYANLLITRGTIFAEDAQLLENWVQGERYILKEDGGDFRGIYALNIERMPALRMEIGGKPGQPELTIVQDTARIKGSFKPQGEIVTISFTPRGQKAAIRLTGWVTPQGFTGDGQLLDGTWTKWNAPRSGNLPDTAAQRQQSRAAAQDSLQLGQVTYPFVAFGYAQAPQAQAVLIRNATVWTNERDGVMQNADVLLRNGKIERVGQNLAAGNARVIDGTGKHVTPGIIDEHSHIGIARGVNEGTQSITAEVRIGDVLNPDDINIYRQLAGGVTAAQLLHGSANAIGGQSALIKLRWGASPEQMKIQGADGFIKFALGENVKQSNWGELQTVRFPQSRMGVEQVFVDGFTRAREYERSMRAFNSQSARQRNRAQAQAQAPRRDLEMETLVEILNGRRFISCHSYVQSEINMLMHVADSFGFKVNTFTHILEGYKVADKMKRHGVGGSTFADWWAYKMEVKDAIPYNAAIMYRVGLTTAINSDDAEMGRRLNQEAAKTVKYGGVPEEEALKMVTLNPAILLHLDNRMGSIRAGKDADIVVWNTHPLSIYARPEKTFVDGIAYFDMEVDQRMRDGVRTERNRLIQKMIAAKQQGGKTQQARPRGNRVYHCEDQHDVWNEEHAHHED
jgi:imidazolonepropionase-like amidohydrolase